MINYVSFETLLNIKEAWPIKSDVFLLPSFRRFILKFPVTIKLALDSIKFFIFSAKQKFFSNINTVLSLESNACNSAVLVSIYSDRTLSVLHASL